MMWWQDDNGEAVHNDKDDGTDADTDDDFDNGVNEDDVDSDDDDDKLIYWSWHKAVT